MEDKTHLNKFLVSFHGSFIPLQGAEYIVEAAARLRGQPIQFQFIGDGQTHNEVLKKAQSLGIPKEFFMPKLSFEKLADCIRQADVCLGIFGNTGKTQRVIPNKLYEAIAMGKPVISANTPAIREVFTDRGNILLCNTADGADLADKIMMLKDNPTLRANIAKAGYELYLRKATPRIIGKQLLADLS
jgi:glycosyltransferase involved in cell wall biosynthesis